MSGGPYTQKSPSIHRTDSQIEGGAGGAGSVNSSSLPSASASTSTNTQPISSISQCSNLSRPLSSTSSSSSKTTMKGLKKRKLPIGEESGFPDELYGAASNERKKSKSGHVQGSTSERIEGKKKAKAIDSSITNDKTSLQSSMTKRKENNQKYAKKKPQNIQKEGKGKERAEETTPKIDPLVAIDQEIDQGGGPIEEFEVDAIMAADVYKDPETGTLRWVYTPKWHGYFLEETVHENPLYRENFTDQDMVKKFWKSCYLGLPVEEDVAEPRIRKNDKNWRYTVGPHLLSFSLKEAIRSYESDIKIIRKERARLRKRSETGKFLPEGVEGLLVKLLQMETEALAHINDCKDKAEKADEVALESWTPASVAGEPPEEDSDEAGSDIQDQLVRYRTKQNDFYGRKQTGKEAAEKIMRDILQPIPKPVVPDPPTSSSTKQSSKGGSLPPPPAQPSETSERVPVVPIPRKKRVTTDSEDEAEDLIDDVQPTQQAESLSAAAANKAPSNNTTPPATQAIRGPLFADPDQEEEEASTPSPSKGFRKHVPIWERQQAASSRTPESQTSRPTSAEPRIPHQPPQDAVSDQNIYGPHTPVSATIPGSISMSNIPQAPVQTSTAPATVSAAVAVAAPAPAMAPTSAFAPASAPALTPPPTPDSAALRWPTAPTAPAIPSVPSAPSVPYAPSAPSAPWAPSNSTAPSHAQASPPDLDSARATAPAQSQSQAPSTAPASITFTPRPPPASAAGPTRATAVTPVTAPATIPAALAPAPAPPSVSASTVSAAVVPPSLPASAAAGSSTLAIKQASGPTTANPNSQNGQQPATSSSNLPGGNQPPATTPSVNGNDSHSVIGDGVPPSSSASSPTPSGAQVQVVWEEPGVAEPMKVGQVLISNIVVNPPHGRADVANKDGDSITLSHLLLDKAAADFLRGKPVYCFGLLEPNRNDSGGPDPMTGFLRELLCKGQEKAILARVSDSTALVIYRQGGQVAFALKSPPRSPNLPQDVYSVAYVNSSNLKPDRGCARVNDPADARVLESIFANVIDIPQEEWVDVPALLAYGFTKSFFAEARGKSVRIFAKVCRAELMDQFKKVQAAEVYDGPDNSKEFDIVIFENPQVDHLANTPDFQSQLRAQADRGVTTYAFGADRNFKFTVDPPSLDDQKSTGVRRVLEIKGANVSFSPYFILKKPLLFREIVEQLKYYENGSWTCYVIAPMVGFLDWAKDQPDRCPNLADAIQALAFLREEVEILPEIASENSLVEQNGDILTLSDLAFTEDWEELVRAANKAPPPASNPRLIAAASQYPSLNLDLQELNLEIAQLRDVARKRTIPHPVDYSFQRAVYIGIEESPLEEFVNKTTGGQQFWDQIDASDVERFTGNAFLNML